MFVWSCIKLVVVAAVGVSGSQRGDNFRVIDRVFVGFFNITLVKSILVGVGGRKSEKNGLVTGASCFSFPRLTLRARFALRSKCCVHLAWLIKCLLCRLL